MNCIDPVAFSIYESPKVHHIAFDCASVFDGDEVTDELHGFAKIAFEFGSADALNTLIFDQVKRGIQREFQNIDLINDLLSNVDFFQLRHSRLTKVESAIPFE